MIIDRIARYFSIAHIKRKQVKLKTAKNKSVSSQHWLTRQFSDPYVDKAKMMNYRCRSAFKLIEIDDKYKFLHPGQLVIDCGASPGSWTQVAVSRVNADNSLSNRAQGAVVSIDKQQTYPIEGATILGNMDFTLPDAQNRLREIIGTRRQVDVVLSDMAPSATGIAALDQENIVKLCYATLRFAVQVSAVGSVLLLKLWQCGETKQLQQDILRFYETCEVVKPQASRANSAEIFLLSREFKGLKSRS